MKKCKKWLVLFVIGIVSSSCSLDPKQDIASTTNVPPNTVSEPQNKINNYEGAGVIISITPNKKQVIIKHGIIPGFMEAMTMPFNVPDSSILVGIHPQDSIKLFIEYDGTNITLKEIRKVK